MARENLSGATAAFRDFIDRNRDEIENYISSDHEFVIKANGMIEMRAIFHLDVQAVRAILASELPKLVAEVEK